jgi:hypothetical protein
MTGRLALEPTQPLLYLGVKELELYAHHSPPFNADAYSVWSLPLCPTYALVVWYFSTKETLIYVFHYTFCFTMYRVIVLNENP